MSDIVLRVEDLSKEYRLGMIGRGTLRQDVQSWWAKLRGREDPNALINLYDQNGNATGLNVSNRRFWVLKNISFSVKQGEVLGIVGANGAGKSTLLKIISRITFPTKGRIKAKGRIASLLEVGTGFHPELTGRENIYLNGAILGMRKMEVGRKLDEIIDFSGIEKFIDTPVKRYSSGMHVRLAFAVAAHLEPEILIVDEVLAVGDAEFQKKCLGKMNNVVGEGRTILFVSHNMNAIKQLCPSSLLIEHGLLVCYEHTPIVLQKYKELMAAKQEKKIIQASQIDFKYHSSDFQINSMKITNSMKHTENVFSINEAIHIELIYEVRKKTPALMVCIYLHKDGELFLSTFDTDQNDRLASFHVQGRYTAHIEIPAYHLREGVYALSCGASISNKSEGAHRPKDQLQFSVSTEDIDCYTRSYHPGRSGLFLLGKPWQVKVEPSLAQNLS